MLLNTISIVIPTKNEEKNISNLITEFESVKMPMQFEIIIVDDSTDKTPKIAAERGCRVIKGKGLGLGQAIVDGIADSQGEYVVVMDADLSHSPRSVEPLIHALSHDGYDLAIGSRYVKGGNTVGWELNRRVVSRIACLLALPITLIKDATSGFFAFRKSLINGIELKALSWKIALEILLKTRPTRVAEIPITFEVRKQGKSKFNTKQVMFYLKHLVMLFVWKYQRFLKFCLVGGSGGVLTFSLTWILTEVFGFWYMLSLTIAVLCATATNYTLNTIWTYRIDVDTDAPDYDWKAYYKGNLVQRIWKRKLAEVVWNFVPNASKLLDIGCGSSPIITKYPNAIAIDINEKKLEFMREKFPLANYVVSSGERIKYDNSTFDHIICIEVVEHIKNPEELISEINRVLKIGSKVVIATPDYNKLLWRIAERFTPYKEKHITQFTKEKLEELCLQFGLVPERHKYIMGCDLVEEFRKNYSFK